VKRFAGGPGRKTSGCAHDIGATFTKNISGTRARELPQPADRVHPRPASGLALYRADDTLRGGTRSSHRA
jgi:hypothetical protein